MEQIIILRFKNLENHLPEDFVKTLQGNVEKCTGFNMYFVDDDNLHIGKWEINDSDIMQMICEDFRVLCGSCKLKTILLLTKSLEE